MLLPSLSSGALCRVLAPVPAGRRITHALPTPHPSTSGRGGSGGFRSKRSGVPSRAMQRLRSGAASGRTFGRCRLRGRPRCARPTSPPSLSLSITPPRSPRPLRGHSAHPRHSSPPFHSLRSTHRIRPSLLPSLLPPASGQSGAPPRASGSLRSPPSRMAAHNSRPPHTPRHPGVAAAVCSAPNVQGFRLGRCSAYAPGRRVGARSAAAVSEAALAVLVLPLRRRFPSLSHPPRSPRPLRGHSAHPRPSSPPFHSLRSTHRIHPSLLPSLLPPASGQSGAAPRASGSLRSPPSRMAAHYRLFYARKRAERWQPHAPRARFVRPPRTRQPHYRRPRAPLGLGGRVAYSANAFGGRRNPNHRAFGVVFLRKKGKNFPFAPFNALILTLLIFQPLEIGGKPLKGARSALETRFDFQLFTCLEFLQKIARCNFCIVSFYFVSLPYTNRRGLHRPRVTTSTRLLTPKIFLVWEPSSLLLFSLLLRNASPAVRH